MEFKYSVELKDKVAKINLSGRLDAANAPVFSEEIKKLVGQDFNKIVFFLKDLEYVSSAGLRVLVFAKQKMGASTQVFVVSPQQDVVDVIKMTGFDSFLTIQDSYTD